VSADSPRLVSVAATEIRDPHDRLFGYALVARDVTRRHNREQRLALLNQLLVDIAHDRMEMVTQQVTALADGESTERRPASVGDRVWDATTELTSLVARTREIERALTDDTDPMTTQRTDVSATIRSIVADLADEDVDLVTRFPDERLETTIDETLVEVATRTLLEDAVDTGVGPVALEVEQSDVGAIGIRLTVRVPVDPASTDVTSIDELSIQVARLAINCVGGRVTTDDPPHARVIRLRLPTDPDDVGVVDEDPIDEPLLGGVRP